MADFSFNIPEASGTPQVFEEATPSFYEGFQLPTGSETDTTRTAILAQLANQQLDGSAAPMMSILDMPCHF